MRLILFAILALLAAPLAAAEPVCLPDDIRCTPIDLRDTHAGSSIPGWAYFAAGSYEGADFSGIRVNAEAREARVTYEQGRVGPDEYTLVQVFARPDFWVVSYYHNDDTGTYGQGFTCLGVAGNLDGGLVSKCEWRVYPGLVQVVLNSLP